MARYDVVIVGGGIIGTAVARRLSCYRLKVALVEACPDLACGTTKANGGIIHAGYGAKHGTLKSRMNVIGNREYPRLASELGFKYKNTGSLVVGFGGGDSDYIHDLYINGKLNGVPGLEILDDNQARIIEPKINPEAKLFLYAPTAGMVDPFEVALALAENAVANGVEVYRNCAVTGIRTINGGFILHTGRGDFITRTVVNAAGIYADDIAALAGQRDLAIKARLGEMLVFDKEMEARVNTVVFPIPSGRSKGIVVIPAVSGNMLISATARMVEDKEDIATTSSGIQDLIEGTRRMIPSIDEHRVIREFSGLRAVAEGADDDFIVGPAPGIPGFINAAGIQSPGIASAPAIADLVRDMLADQGLDLQERADFNPHRQAPVSFSGLSDAGRDRLINIDPAYGQVICRCEGVTAGEIVDAIRRPVGATTIDGVKRRTRTGMGRCQGGFCQPRVLAILSRELGRDPWDIWLEYRGSEVVKAPLKEVKSGGR
jgi:glycerol-3-phosphate dehydrogenase